MGPPTIAMHSGPSRRIGSSVVIITTHGSIKIPHRPKSQSPVTREVHVGGETKTVGILGEFVENVKINPGRLIHVAVIRRCGRCVVTIPQRPIHVVEVVDQEGSLSGGHFRLLGFDKRKRLRPTGESTVSRVQSINLEHVAATDFGQCRVPLKHLVHIHPILPTLDLLHQHIHSHIRCAIQWPTALIDIHLTKSGAHGITTDTPTQFIHQRVAHQCSIKIIRRVKNPVRLLGHTQERHIAIVAMHILDFH